MGAQKKTIEFARKNKTDIDAPWADLPAKQRHAIWAGAKGYHGVEGYFDHLEDKKYKMHVRVFLARYKSPFLCETCQGSRLRPEANMVLIGGKNVTEVAHMTLKDLNDFCATVKLTPQQQTIANEVYKQVRSRLSFLIEVGVDYLTLDRQTRTLSGGEYQRINLANQLAWGFHKLYTF